MNLPRLPQRVQDLLWAPRAIARQPLRVSSFTYAFWIGLAFGGYFILRYSGQWAEIDSVAFSGIISNLQHYGSFSQDVNPKNYPHGYAYPVWMASLSYLTGLPVGELMRWYTPMVGNLFLALFGFCAYRRWLGSDRLGLLAASVLFLVPELVFTVSRGNHEKITVSLTLLASLALLKSFLEIQARNWKLFASWLTVYYFISFTLSSLNVLFGSSFIVASTLTVVVAWVFLRFRPSQWGIIRKPLERLTLRIATSWLLVLIVMWYIYPSAGDNFNLLKTAVEKLGSLFLSFTPESNPYVQDVDPWASVLGYRLISSFRWILFGVSFLTWMLLLAPTVFRNSKAPLTRVFLLALYGAFGFQMAVAIPVDLLGLEAGSNLQVRMYTYFVLFAAPVFVLGLTRLVGPRTRVLVALVMTAFGFLSVVKATLDPHISNLWLQYTRTELQAIRTWARYEESSLLYAGRTTRLNDAWYMNHGLGLPNDNNLVTGDYNPRAYHALYSSTQEANNTAWRFRQPLLLLDNRVYDNGDAQIYHRLPRTPFQK